jgi:hypothetical protein
MLQNAAPLIVFIFIFGPSRNYVVSAFSYEMLWTTITLGQGFDGESVNAKTPFP